jgi:hypothetical protein
VGGIVNDDVEPPKMLNCLINERSNSGPLANINNNQLCLSARRFDGGAGFFSGIHRAGSNDHVRPFSGKKKRSCTTYAPAGAGD